MAEEGLAYIIENTHFGSLEATLEDIKKLGNSDEQSQWFRNAVRNHCERNLYKLANAEDTEHVVVSAHNRKEELEDGSTTYIDLTTNKVYTVCFCTRKIVASAPVEESEGSDAQTVGQKVASGIRRYLDEFFSKSSAGYGSLRAD